MLTEQRCAKCLCVFLPCVQIAVIASRSLDCAKEFAKKHCIPKAYGSYEELANDPDIGELTVRNSLCAKAEIRACWSYCLCPNRHCVPGGFAHGALESWSAVPQGWKERVV